MVTLVIYDIPDDRVRGKIAEACKDYGLQRAQFSAFVGSLTHNRREELQRRLRKTLGKHQGNIQVWVICDKDVQLRFEVDQGEDGGPYSSRYG